MTLIPDNIHDSWDDLITEDFSAELNRIEEILDQLPLHTESGYPYFPVKEKVMRFLEINLNNIRYVILGMDPYPSWFNVDNLSYPVATGRSFEVGNLDNWATPFKQKSLCNIIKTIYYNETGDRIGIAQLRRAIKNDPQAISEPHQFFNRLEAQGVLFLNATLTVLPNAPDSHTDLWYLIMTQVIQYINNHRNNVGWLLFGLKAQNRIDEAIDGEYRSYCACHPRLEQFIDENVFAQVNDIQWLV